MDSNEGPSLPDESLPKTYPPTEYVTSGVFTGDKKTPLMTPQIPAENRIEITDHQDLSILDIHEAPITGSNSPKTPINLSIQLVTPHFDDPE
jgi:hypothetical protein